MNMKKLSMMKMLMMKNANDEEIILFNACKNGNIALVKKKIFLWKLE